MRKLLLPLLLLASFTAAAVDIDPKTVGGAVVQADLEWTVDSGGGSATELSLKTYSFYSDGRQSFEVSSADAHSASADSNGNPLLVFSLDPSLQTSEVSYSAVVRTRQSLDFAPAANASAYLGESELVKISSGISGKAVELASDGGLRSAASLSEWVHNNVRYDGPGYGSSSLDSAEVFELRGGTCDEFSHLLIALLRSRGVPAKFVAGFVYSGEEWVAHAWVEAAVDGEWIPFDPTFNEAIVLDGTHLKFAEGRDQSEIREEITGRGTGLDLGRASVTRRSSLSFSATAPFENLFSLNASAPAEQLGEGSLAVVTARVSNTASQPVAAPLSIVVPEEMRIVSAEDALLFL
ncbi:MAG: transglutaminase domain-containing protein, partial [Candidatus Micrarchaeota archaeon]